VAGIFIGCYSFAIPNGSLEKSSNSHTLHPFTQTQEILDTPALGKLKGKIKSVVLPTQRFFQRFGECFTVAVLGASTRRLVLDSVY
jgi:hypothetical protein